MFVSDQILSFYKSIRIPELPEEVQVLNPYGKHDTWELVQKFYEKYYSNDAKRIIVFGINPGRFGGGITGIPFTDPIRLEQHCHIKNHFEKRRELSSQFIYEMIDAYGGTDLFYSNFYVSALSPLGYVRSGKNLNYYDINGWKEIFTDYAIEMIERQLPFVRYDLAICIGQGQNLKFLESLNMEHHFFDRIETVPHPRWIMQYRLKRKEEFIQEYIDKLAKA